MSVSNSKVVIPRVLRDYDCVVCGGREYDVRETTAVGPDQDSDLVGDRYEQCRACGEMYDTPTADSNSDPAENTEENE